MPGSDTHLPGDERPGREHMPEDELDGFGTDVDELFGDSSRGREEAYAPRPTPEPVRPAQNESRGLAGTWLDTLQQRLGGMFLKTLLNVVVLLLIVVGAAHAFYSYLFPDGPPTLGYDVTSVAEPAVDQTRAPDSQPPVAAPVVAAAPTVPDEEGSFVIQIGRCVYPSCVTDFQQRLSQFNLPTEVTEISTTWETVEVYSQTTFQTRAQAEVLVTRINSAPMMEDLAYVLADSNEFRVSMGNFDNPVRANTVMDSLNSLLRGEASFTTRVWEFPQTMHSIVAGNFSSRREAEAARSRLAQADSVFAQAYVVER